MRRLNSKRHLFTLTASLFYSSCGQFTLNDSSKYDGNKSYGKPPGLNDDVSRKPPSGGEDETDWGQDNYGGDSTPPAADSFVIHTFNAATFDKASAQRIRDGHAPDTIPALVANQVRNALTTTQGDGLEIGQYFGDGHRVAAGYQNITMSAVDASAGDGQGSTSAMKAYDRITGGLDCPFVALCVYKFVRTPKSGSPFTVCFYDPSTSTPKLFPNSATPNYQWADVERFLGDYGPYLAKRFAGDSVDCENPGQAAVLEETITAKISGVQNPAVTYLMHTISPLTANFEVGFEYSRVSNDMVHPYIDETIMVMKKTRYFVSETAGLFTKLIATNRASIDIAEQAGNSGGLFGSLFGDLISALVNMDGVQADVHFELCQNLLKPDEPSYCPTN